MNAAIEDAKTRDVRVVADSLGLAVTPNGKGAHCTHSRGPGRGTPSMTFYRAKDGRQKFKCHSCGEGGDVIDLVQFVLGCDGKEAIRHLTGTLPEVRQEWKAVEDESERVPYPVRVKACTAFYGGCAPLDVVAKRFLEDERGISAETAGEGFGFRVLTHDRGAIGQSGDRAFRALMEATGPAVAQALRLAKASNKSDTLYMRLWGHWLVIPYFDAEGQIGHLQFRRLHRGDDKQDGPKYWHAGEVPYPWNYAACCGEGHPGRTLVVEGALDALSLECRNVPAIGIPGTRWLRPEAAARIAKRATSTLVVGFDADEERQRSDGTKYRPGPDAQADAVKMLGAAGADVAQVEWPEGFTGDWCDWWMAGNRGMPHERREINRVRFTLADALHYAAEQQQAIAQGRLKDTFIRTGLGKVVDQVLGTEAGECNLIGARPSGGKSHLMLSVAVAQAEENGFPVGIVSLEMTHGALGLRALMADMGASRSDWYDFSEAKRTWMTEEAKTHLDRYEGLRVRHPDDKSRAGVIAACEELMDEGCRIVWIDHVQHVARKGVDMWTVIDEAARGLDELFKRRRVPYYLLVQLSRAIERRANRQPLMSDFKGCGSLEEVADRMVAISCPAEYEEDRDERDHELNKLKDRNGGTSEGRCTLYLPNPFGWFLPTGNKGGGYGG